MPLRITARSELFSSKSGKGIGANDLLIAAHARSLGLVLATNDTRKFKRVPGLKWQNWC